jgi:hypothetical protein
MIQLRSPVGMRRERHLQVGDLDLVAVFGAAVRGSHAAHQPATQLHQVFGCGPTPPFFFESRSASSSSRRVKVPNRTASGVPGFGVGVDALRPAARA